MFYFTALCKLEWGLRWNEDKNVFISPHYYSVHKLYPCFLKHPRAVLNQHFHESLTMFWQRNINCRPGVLNPPPSNRLFTSCLRFCNILPFEDWKIVAAFQKLWFFVRYLHQVHSEYALWAGPARAVDSTRQPVDEFGWNLVLTLCHFARHQNRDFECPTTQWWLTITCRCEKEIDTVGDWKLMF